MEHYSAASLPDGVTPCQLAYLRVTGIKRGCRSTKAFTLSFGFWPLGASHEDLEQQARGHIRDTFKSVSGNKFEISLQAHSIERRDDTIYEHSSYEDITNAKRKEVIL